MQRIDLFFQIQRILFSLPVFFTYKIVHAMIKMRQMTPLLFDKTIGITNNYYYLPMDKTHQPSHTVHYKQRQSGSMLGIGIVWKICHVKLWTQLTPMNTLVDGMRNV